MSFTLSNPYTKTLCIGISFESVRFYWSEILGIHECGSSLTYEREFLVLNFSIELNRGKETDCKTNGTVLTMAESRGFFVGLFGSDL